LGYKSGHLVPYKYSELMEKQKCATSQQPVTSSKPGLPLASWEDARSGLRWLLTEPAGHGGSIQLPNVKRLFQSELGLELSETALGYARIFELLHDVHMSSVCDLRLEGKNWMVVRKQVEPVVACCDLSAPQPLEAGARWPLLEGAPFIAAPMPAAPMPESDMMRNAFRCLSTTPLAVLAPTLATLPVPLATNTAPPVDVDEKVETASFASSETFHFGSVDVDEKFETASFASTADPMESDLDSPRSSSNYRSGSASPEPEEPVEIDFDFIVKNTFIHVAPSPTARRFSSVPGCMRLGRSR
jgi:hypothetical protein